MPNSERSDGRRFDREYAVTTQAILFLSDLDPDDVGDAGYHATHYEGVPVADFRALLALVPADAIAKSTFVDVGAGMGRALILASELPFRQVVGVEVSASLYEVARENLETAQCPLRRCNDVRIVRADARMWTYPPGDLVVFLYNPFDASALEIALGAISSRRRNGATWLIYHTPVHREIIESDNRFRIAAEISCGSVYVCDEPPSD